MLRLCSEYYYNILYEIPILVNSCIAYNSYDFSSKYLRGQIGELIYANNLPYNFSAFQLLQDLLKILEKKARKTNKDKILKFIRSFKKYRYNNIVIKDDNDGQGYGRSSEFNYEDRGLGITHYYKFR